MKSKQKRYETDMAVRVPYFKGSITGFIDTMSNKNEMIVSTNAEIKYRSPAGKQEQISLNNRYHLQEAEDRKTVTINGYVKLKVPYLFCVICNYIVWNFQMHTV